MGLVLVHHCRLWYTMSISSRKPTHSLEDVTVKDVTLGIEGTKRINCAGHNYT